MRRHHADRAGRGLRRCASRCSSAAGVMPSMRAGLGQRCRPLPLELLAHFGRQAGEPRIVEVGRDDGRLVAPQAATSRPGARRRRRSGRRPRAARRCPAAMSASSGQMPASRAMIDARIGQQLEGRAAPAVLVDLEPGLAAPRSASATGLAASPRRPPAPRPCRRTPRRARADAAERLAERRQPLIGVVGPEPQAELGARREHAVGLADAPRHQIVDHHADIAVGARQTMTGSPPPAASAALSRRASPGRRLLVAGGAVDLAGQEQPGSASPPASASARADRRSRTRWHSPAA